MWPENEVRKRDNWEKFTSQSAKARNELSLIPLLASAIENSAHPKALANTAKHLAFTHCGELNLYGMVEAQITTVEHELLAITVAAQGT